MKFRRARGAIKAFYSILRSMTILQEYSDVEKLLLLTAAGFARIFFFFANLIIFLSVDCASKIGHTPLHLACRFGHLPVVLLLLANHAELNSRDKDDNTPLHKAASNGKALLCRELVKRGADIDARNDTGYTPLHWACFKVRVRARARIRTAGFPS